MDARPAPTSPRSSSLEAFQTSHRHRRARAAPRLLARGRRREQGQVDDLRRRRPALLPAAVAEQPLHGLQHRHRDAAPGPPAGGDAGECRRQADRALPVHAQRRVLARRAVPDLRPGPRPQAHGRGADHRPAQLHRPQRADRRDRRRDAEAPADLGRARRGRAAQLGAAADDPPGQEPRRGPPLHRRAAPDARREGAAAEAEPSLRTRCAPATSTPSATTRCSARCAAPASSARRSTWPGTSAPPASATSPSA